MKRTLLFLCLVACCVIKLAAQVYQSLDLSQPIEWEKDYILFDGQKIELGPKTFFLDGQLSDEQIKGQPYVFNSFQKAAEQFIDGSESEPMRAYIAPYVYWIDDPNDMEIKKGKNGREPFGMVVKCQNLHLIGLNDNPRNVVFASWRGQTQGAIGNFTMFDFWGDGMVVKNLTMGNFCNVELEYPLKKELSKEKRNSAITQAHVAYCHGDKIYAENVHFISRLNMNPLNGAKRILFNKCHMESTDDALTGTGVYLNCTFHFYGERPFWRSDMGGAIFLNSDFYVKHDNDYQYFCKAVGPLSIVDCRYHTNREVYAGWTAYPTDWLRCYQYNVQMNGKPYVIGSVKPYNTVCIDQLNLLNAYRVEIDGQVVYNTYNLLRGDDDWDPMHIKHLIEVASQRNKKDYTRMPTCLSVSPLQASIQTGEQHLKLSALVKRHCNLPIDNEVVRWRVQPGFERFVKLSNEEGLECTVEATNHEDETQQFTIIASTEDGLECAVELTVSPDFIESPSFIKTPSLKIEKGKATVSYDLDLQGRDDQSLVTWYRCLDKSGNGAIPVSVSRLNEPEYTYELRKEDVGYYLMVGVAPKHLRCMPGKELQIVSRSSIKKKDVIETNVYETDFQNFPSKNQPQLLPGFWTVDGYKPIDTSEYNWKVDMSKDYWIYGEGFNGARGTGLLQDQKGARLLYTPLDKEYGDMKVELYVDPTKMAGQGFGSATGQYMDVYIKFDTKTLTGYALRIIRTTKFSNAVDFLLMKYEHGKAIPITDPISSICYRTGCSIRLEVEKDVLSAHVETETPLPPIRSAELTSKVDLDVRIDPNGFGGTGVQHTGSCGESTTMLHALKVEWK